MTGRPLPPSMLARIKSNADTTARKRTLAGDTYTKPVPERFATSVNHQSEMQLKRRMVNRHGRPVWS